MSNSYIGYLKRRNPIKYISDMFRPRRRAPPAEEPPAAQVVAEEEPRCCADGDDDDGVRVIWSGRAATGNESSVSLDECELRERLGRIPFSRSEGGTSVASAQSPSSRRVYPWQNFTVETAARPPAARSKFQHVRSVDSLAREMIGDRRRAVARRIVETSRAAKQKEVKINRQATATSYPRCGERLVEQARFNLSTSSGCPRKRSEPGRPRSGYRKCSRCGPKLKYTPAELGNFWCADK